MRIIMPCWIVNEDCLRVTEQAIESLKGHELVIIDNGSPMGGGYLRSVADIYIRNKENLGYAKAVNQGLKLTNNGQLVAIANNDIKVSANWAFEAEEILKDPKVGSVHFRMIGYDEIFNFGIDTWKSGKERWCTSSFFVVRNVQLYDENYLNTYDDWDFWYRMRQLGYTQAYTNKANYQHKDSFTVQFLPDRLARNEENKEYFKKKHGDYAENLFERDFPGELAKPWLPMP